jgi:hypothetical protein
MIPQFECGDRVRIDIPDEIDLDFDRLNRKIGEVVEVIEDDAGAETGVERDSVLYCVSLADEDAVVDVRWRELRPV